MSDKFEFDLATPEELQSAVNEVTSSADDTINIPDKPVGEYGEIPKVPITQELDVIQKSKKTAPQKEEYKVYDYIVDPKGLIDFVESYIGMDIATEDKSVIYNTFSGETDLSKDEATLEYGRILDAFGIDPKIVNRDRTTGERVIPPFIRPYERPANREEEWILRERNPDYIKYNAVGQPVPMTLEEARMHGWKKRNVFSGVMNNLMLTGAGIAAYFADLVASPDLKLLRDLGKSEKEYKRYEKDLHRVESLMAENIPEELRPAFEKGVPEAIKRMDIHSNGRVFRQHVAKDMKEVTPDTYKEIFGRKWDDRNEEDFLQNAIDFWKSEHEATSPIYLADPIQDLKDGDWLELGKFAGVSLLESLPVMLLAATTKNPHALFAMISIYGAGTQYAQIRDNPDMDGTMKWLNATGYGVVEGGFETYVGVGQIARTLRKMGSTGAKHAFSRGLLGTLGFLGAATGEEASEEFGTEMLQEPIALLTGEREWMGWANLLERGGIAAGVGGLGGFLFGGSGLLITRHKLDNNYYKLIKEYSDEEAGAPPTIKIPKIFTESVDTNKIDIKADEAYAESVRKKKRFNDFLFNKRKLGIRNDFASALTDNKPVILNTLTRLVSDGVTIADTIESLVRRDATKQEVIEYLKEKGLFSIGSKSYVDYIYDNELETGLIETDFVGDAATKLQRGKASVSDARFYIAESSKINERIQYVRDLVEGFEKYGKRETRTAQLELDNLWKDFTKGLRMKFSKSDMATITGAIRNVTPTNISKKIDVISGIVDKNVKLALTTLLKKSAKSGTHLFPIFSEPINMLFDSINNNGTIDVSGIVDTINNGKTDPNSMISAIYNLDNVDTTLIENLNGKPIDELTTKEARLLADTLRLFEQTNRLLMQAKFDGKNIIEAREAALDRIEQMRDLRTTSRENKAGRLASFAKQRLMNVKKKLGTIDPIASWFSVAKMQIKQDGVEIDFRPEDRIVLTNVQNAFSDASGLMIQVYKMAWNQLSYENAKRLAGKDAKFRGKFGGKRTISIGGRQVSLSYDELLTIGLTAMRPEGKAVLMNGGLHKTKTNTLAIDWAATKSAKRGAVPKETRHFQTYKMTQKDINKVSRIIESNADLKQIRNTVSYIIDDVLYPLANRTHIAVYGESLSKSAHYIKLLHDAADINHSAVSRSHLGLSPVTPSFLRKTTGSVKPINIYGISYMFNRMVREQTHFAATAEALADVRLFFNPEIRARIKDAHGDTALDDIDSYIRRISRPNIMPEGIDRITLQSRRMITKGTLAFKVFTVARQTLSFFLGAEVAPMLSGVKPRDMWIGLAKSLVGKGLSNERVNQILSAQNKFGVSHIEARANGSLMSSYSGQDVVDFNIKRDLVAISKMDNATVRALLTGLYDGLVRQGRENEFLEKSLAVLNWTQPVFDPSVKAKFFNSFIGRNVGMFYSGISKMDNSVTNTMHYVEAGGNKRTALRVILIGVFLAQLGHTALDKLRDIVLGRKTKISKKELLKQTAYKVATMDWFGQIPVNLIKKMNDDFAFGIAEIPVLGAVEETFGGIDSLITGSREHDVVKKVRGAERFLKGLDKLTLGVGFAGISELSKIALHARNAFVGERDYINIEGEPGEIENMIEEIDLYGKQVSNELKTTDEVLHEWLYRESMYSVDVD